MGKKVGDKVEVKVVEIDNMGRINLSMILKEEPREGKPRYSQPRRRSPQHPQRRQYRRR